MRVVEEALHPLRRWRLSQSPKMTLDAAAALVGTVRQVWYDWEKGRRIPDPTFMPRIYRATGREITPNDFYFPEGLPDLDTHELPLAPASAPLLDAIEGDENVEDRGAETELQAAAA